MVLPISQFTVLVAPTAAVACVPRLPTMAVSIYCTAVCISISSIVGQASASMVPSIVKSICSSFLSGCVPRIIPVPGIPAVLCFNHVWSMHFRLDNPAKTAIIQECLCHTTGPVQCPRLLHPAGSCHAAAVCSVSTGKTAVQITA